MREKQKVHWIAYIVRRNYILNKKKNSSILRTIRKIHREIVYYLVGIFVAFNMKTNKHHKEEADLRRGSRDE